MIDYHSLYKFILPLHILFCLLLGICFYLIKHEGTPKLQGYYIGRRLIAAGYLLLALACFVQFAFLQDESINTTQVVFLISNACDTSLFALGLTKMVDMSFITRRRVLFEIGFVSLISAILIGVYVYDENSPSLTMQITFLCCVGALFIKQIFNYIHFGKRYLSAKMQLDNYYSNNVGVHLDWVNGSFALFSTLMVIALVGCTIPYFWVIIALILIIWGSFLYIFINTINYAPKIMIIERVLEANEMLAETTSHSLQDTTLSPDKSGVVSPGNMIPAPPAGKIPVFAALDKWIGEELYLNPGVTIEEVAARIGTNRNKISLHLNTYLNMSFREWITKLRIEKARQLLLEKPDLTITEIGTLVSIPNRSNFDKMFKKLVGESPATYRSNHSKNPL